MVGRGVVYTENIIGNDTRHTLGKSHTYNVVAQSC